MERQYDNKEGILNEVQLESASIIVNGEMHLIDIVFIIYNVDSCAPSYRIVYSGNEAFRIDI